MTTNFATANYQEIIDLHTESDTVSVIGLHTPNTDTPVKMLSGFWNQFKKVKYQGCSISLVPAARLPADPLQVSYAAGETTIDPRDMLNPILFHGCHGNDMGAILNTLYSSSGTTDFLTRKFTDSAEQNVFSETQVGNEYVDALYYKALTDNTWRKVAPQSGFKKSGLRPMVYSVKAGMQYAPYDTSSATTFEGYGPYTGGNSSKGASDSLGTMGDVSGTLHMLGTPTPMESVQEAGAVLDSLNRGAGQVSFFTQGLTPLGWLDTRSVPAQGTGDAQVTGTASTDATAVGGLWKSVQAPLTTIPKIFMGMIMLPPAYKTEQYFRLVINHNFAFKGFRGISMVNDTVEDVNNAYGYSNLN